MYASAARLVVAALLLVPLAGPTHAEPGQWSFGASYAPIIGLRTEYRGFGNFQNPFPVPAPASGTNYFYTNGSVQVDISGNAGGQTQYWSYNNASQYNPTGGTGAGAGQGSISFSTLSGGVSNAGSVADNNVGSALGFEVHGYLDLGSVSFLPKIAGREVTWGLRTGLQYARVYNSNGLGQIAGVGTITDSFNLYGVIPPSAPYTGSFAGPGALLGDTPSRTTGTAVATISGNRNLDVQLFVSTFGSYLALPITKKVDVMLEGGAVLAIATGNYSYNSLVTVPGVGSQLTSGNKSSTRLLPGVYSSVGLAWHVTDQFSLQTSVRYQFMSQFSLMTNGSNANLSFDSALVLSLGGLYRF
jgi:hypothetical protein